MFAAVRKRKADRQEAARVGVLSDPDRPRPFKPEWLLEADTLAPTVTHVATSPLSPQRKHVARIPVIDDVETSLAEAYPAWKGSNRATRRARRFSSRSASRAAYRARTALSDVEKAMNARDAYEAGCRGRVIAFDDGAPVYGDVVAPKTPKAKVDAYRKQTGKRFLTRKQANRVVKTAARALTS
jgi:hypothetical protein